MSLPETFKTTFVPAKGSPNTIGDRSLAPLKPDEVAIKVTSTAINPVDWKMRDLGFAVDKFPVTLGSDAAGEVVAIGADVSDLAVGDRVWFQGILGSDEGATFQHYSKIYAALVAKTPSNITDDQAATIGVAALAAVTGFYHHTGHGMPAPWDQGGEAAGKGRAIFIIGGSGSVGQYAIQLARLSGFDRIITNSSAAHAENLRRLGAHVVLDRATQATPEDVKAAIGDLPLEFVFDAISSRETQLLAVQTLQLTKTTNSDVITVWHNNDEAVALGKEQEPKVDIKFILGLGSSPEVRPLAEKFMRATGGDDGWLATGQFVPNKVDIVPGGLSAVDTAVDKNKKGVSGIKLVIRPHDA
jgi:NADPH:quinone reductase-like Zn-dependent oxidoreductase